MISQSKERALNSAKTKSDQKNLLLHDILAKIFPYSVLTKCIEMLSRSRHFTTRRKLLIILSFDSARQCVSGSIHDSN